MRITEHEAILKLKDITQMFQAEDREEVDQMFYGQLTLDEIRENLQDYNCVIGEIKQILREVEKALEQEPRWMSVGEGLPKDIKPVQITWRNNEPAPYYQDIKGKHFTGTAHYKDGKWYWYSDVTEDFLAEYGRCDLYEFDSAIEVVALMPMAEPYEMKSEIEE